MRKEPKPRLTPPAGSKDVTMHYGGVAFSMPVGSPNGCVGSPSGSPSGVVGSPNEVALTRPSPPPNPPKKPSDKA